MAALRVAILCAFITVYLVVGQQESESGDTDASRRSRRQPRFCNSTGTCCQFWKVMNESLYNTYTNCSGSSAGILPPPCIGLKGHGGGPKNRSSTSKTCKWECVFKNEGVFNNGSVNVEAFENKVKSILASHTTCFNELSADISRCLRIASTPPEQTTCSHIPFFLNNCISSAAQKICRNQQNRKQAK